MARRAAVARKHAERRSWASSDEAGTLEYLMTLRHNEDCGFQQHAPMSLLTERASAWSPLPRVYCADCGRLLLDV